MKNNKDIRLLSKYLYDKPTFVEKAKVDKWYEGMDEDKAVADPNELLHIKERLYLRTWNKLNSSVKVIPFYKKSLFRISAAAFVAVCITSAFFLLLKKSNSSGSIVEVNSMPLGHDVAAPAINKAVLTLADGSTIILDSAGIGSLAKQGNTIISKVDNGKISYKNNSSEAAKIQFNTLTVPKGSKPMQIVLSDGSKVWVNVGSSITYPTVFAYNERKVKITGEVYFEVIHLSLKEEDKRVPFIVSAVSHLGDGNDVGIQVLGTHFNVNAYNDENSLKVTLLKGSVKVGQHEEKSIYIKPGQQAELNLKGQIGLNTDVDTDEVMAWKTNWFNFSSLTVPEIMRQIERWYDVSVGYENKVPDKHFSGIVSRSNNVSEVLKIMEQAGIKFKIEGRNITVM
ncbi:MAG: FecR domain-containing protein [Ginsengibacter sp.]